MADRTGRRPPSDFEFRPLPLLSNPHVQTLLAHWLQGWTPPFPSSVSTVPLPDGDQLVIHDSRPAHWRAGDPIAVLVHGLGGSHRSGPVRRLVPLLLPHGFRVVRMDLRGSGRGMSLARLPYHAGCSGDVRAVLAAIQRSSPMSPIILVGFSLGGNIVLKLAGETPEHPVANLQRVIAVAPPIDLERCAQLIALPHNRIYERYFLRNLIYQARRKQRHFPDLPPMPFPRPMTLRQFDDLYLAPRCGFRDATDYYRRAAALPFVARIPMPTLILTARDDPFIAVESFEQLKVPDHVEVRILRHGGHLGFLGWDGGGGIRWVERRVAEWIVTNASGRTHGPR